MLCRYICEPGYTMYDAESGEKSNGSIRCLDDEWTPHPYLVCHPVRTDFPATIPSSSPGFISENPSPAVSGPYAPFSVVVVAALIASFLLIIGVMATFYITFRLHRRDCSCNPQCNSLKPYARFLLGRFAGYNRILYLMKSYKSMKRLFPDL